MAYFGICISLTTLQVECSSVCAVQNMTMVSKLPVILRKEQYHKLSNFKIPLLPEKKTRKEGTKW